MNPRTAFLAPAALLVLCSWASHASGTGTGTGAAVPAISPPERASTQERSATPDPADPWRVVFFDTNQARVMPEFEARLDRHAAYLKAQPQARLLLEGHADQRGPQTYNRGLSQRRADAVRRALLQRGVPRAQVQTAGYGEDRPASSRSTPLAYARNRRVEFNYLNGDIADAPPFELESVASRSSHATVASAPH